MTDEPSTPPQATPAGNQNLIIGLVLGVVVLLLFLLVVQIATGGIGGSKDDKFTELEKKIEARRKALNAERAGMGLEPIGAAGQSADALAARLTSDSTALAGMTRQLQALLSQRENELKDSQILASALGRQVESQRKTLDEARLAAANAQSLASQLASTQALLEDANRRVASLQQQLAGSPDQNMVAALQSQRDEAVGQRDALQQQIAALNSELTDLKDKYASLQSEHVKTRYELQKVRAELNRTRLFVEKIDDLPVAAKQLYVELSKLETVGSVAKLKEEYARIDQQLKASVVDTINFQTGSARIDHDRVESIRRSLAASTPDSYFLVVGYASKTGNFDSNRELSSSRATTVASVTDFNKKDTQGVNAVFLGQTDRFSSSDVLSNQICELWEIRK